MRETLIFWGCGKIGKEVLAFWKLHGLKPDYFCEANKDKTGKTYDGIDIIECARIKDFERVTIFVTVYDAAGIFDWIKKANLKNISKAVYVPSCSTYEMLCFVYERLRIKSIYSDLCSSESFIMDFTYGTELGGVQTWCYQQEKVLHEIGMEGMFLMPDNRKHICDRQECVYVSPSNELTKYDNYIDSYVRSIIRSQANVIIINFPREMLYAAAIVKTCFRERLQIIVVIHSDEDIYYDTYNMFSDLISLWFVISDRIERKVVSLGIDRNNIFRLQWKTDSQNWIEIKERSFRVSNKRTIKIAYAGRIVIVAKRIDNIILLARSLREKRLDFELCIAGEGEDEEFLKQEIRDNHLEKNVKYIGFIEHGSIADFWKQQDIYLSCSDYEGHSISQYEAMAVGAVPVVTDTSGAEDDIKDGENGFILSIGDIEGMANKIVFLKDNPAILCEMSKKCIQYIKMKNGSVDYEEFWKKVRRRINE